MREIKVLSEKLVQRDEDVNITRILEGLPMPTDYEVVTDPRIKGRVYCAIGRHMDPETKQVQALEKEPLISDGEGKFMLGTDTAWANR